MYLSPAHSAAVKRVLKRQQRHIRQVFQRLRCIAKNATVQLHRILILEKTALFYLMQLMLGTAVQWRRISMSDLIYRLEMEAKEE